MIDIVLFCDLDWGGIWKNIKLSSLSVEWPSQHKSYLQVITEMEMYLLWSLTILSVCVRHCQQKLFTWRYTLQFLMHGISIGSQKWWYKRLESSIHTDPQKGKILGPGFPVWPYVILLKDISISLLLLRYSISFRSIYSCSRPFIYT